MRARFSAFALREVDYLLRTLHSTHEDHGLPEIAARRSVLDTCRDNRFVRLEVLGSSPEDTAGVSRVLFLAHIFRKGRDVGFAELSDFRVEEGELRYVSGRFIPRERLRAGASFEELSREL